MNIAYRISEKAKLLPQKRSVVFSQREKNGAYTYPFYTFRQFEERSNQIAQKLRSLGIKKGTRTLLFVRPCLDFSVITFALFKIGAVPVLIDPGMGMKNLLSSIRQVKPEAMVSVGLVHWVRRFKRDYFANVKIKVSLDKVGGLTSYLYEDLESMPSNFEIEPVTETDLAAILFTSGGTGIPKGVLYTHGILNAQTDALKEMFHLNENQVDLPGFPLFALFTLAMGMTSVIPDMDPTRPACADPEKIVRNIVEQQATFVAGSPSIWERVGKYCLAHNIQLGSVRQVVMFGAPVRTEIHRMFKQILPLGDTYTPYGATECLPVSLISGSEVLKDKAPLTLQGYGTCIGKAVPGVKIKIVEATDIPEVELKELLPGAIGEIIVSGLQVTPAYFEMEAETNKAKIQVGAKLWHRMGDIGYLDSENNLWFLGRKAHRVTLDQKTTLYPIQIEAIFNQHPEVKRTALVKIGHDEIQVPGLVVERRDGSTKADKKFLAELQQLGDQTLPSRFIQNFFLHSSFPVDVRHNIKIDRIKLSAWARTKTQLPAQGR